PADEPATESAQGMHGIHRPQLALDRSDPNWRATGHLARRVDPGCQRSHPFLGLERISRRYQPPRFIEPERIDREKRNRAVGTVRRIEAAAEKRGSLHFGWRRGDTRKPWRVFCDAMAQWGYSGSGVPSASSRASSAAVSSTSLAARLSASWSDRRAPTMTVETADWCSSQAMAMAEIATPRLSAIGRIASTRSKAKALSTRGKSSLARRPSPCVSSPSPRAYLPVSSPPASGLHTIRPRPSLSSIGTISR